MSVSLVKRSPFANTHRVTYVRTRRSWADPATGTYEVRVTDTDVRNMGEMAPTVIAYARLSQIDAGYSSRIIPQDAILSILPI